MPITVLSMMRALGASIALMAAAASSAVLAQAPERRVALVIGNAAYAGGQLPTALADAGLVAATLREAGFDVLEGGNLDETALRRAIRDYVARAAAAGPGAVSFIYIAGAAAQSEGETVLVPTDARLTSPAALALETVRLSDLTRALAGLPLRARFLVLDAAYPLPFPGVAGQVPPGLPPLTPEPGQLIAYNQGPNQTAPPSQGDYGRYAVALAEMLREPGLSPDAVFQRVRLRVHEQTQGAATPWHQSAVPDGFVFFAPEAQAAAVPPPPPRRAGLAGYPVEEAYAIVVEQDHVPLYQEFLSLYPDHPLARRVRALLAQRREAVLWQRAVSRNTAPAYWTYMKTYPRGAYYVEARRRLTRLQAALEPPPVFEEVVYIDVPPPPPEEIVIVERRYVFVDPLPLPPPLPYVILAPPPPVFVRLPPPVVIVAPMVVGATPLRAPAQPIPMMARAVVPTNVVRPPPPPVLPAQSTTTLAPPPSAIAAPQALPPPQPTVTGPSATTLGIAGGAAAAGAAAALGASRLGTQLPAPPNTNLAPNTRLAPPTGALTPQDLRTRQQQLRAREQALNQAVRSGRISPRQAAAERATLRNEQGLLRQQQRAAVNPGVVPPQTTTPGLSRPGPQLSPPIQNRLAPDNRTLQPTDRGTLQARPDPRLQQRDIRRDRRDLAPPPADRFGRPGPGRDRFGGPPSQQVRQAPPVQQMRQAPPQMMRQLPPQQQVRQAPPVQQMRQAPPVQQMRQAPPQQRQVSPQQVRAPQQQPRQAAPQQRPQQQQCTPQPGRPCPPRR